MDLEAGRLSLGRERSALDDAVVAFADLLDEQGVDYVVVSGYVAILTGRSRSTEDVDVVVEPLAADRAEALVEALDDAGYWGMAMPLSAAREMWEAGDRVRVAEEGEFYPNFEVWYASNPVEREALSAAIDAVFDDASVRISPIELQIAYKLRLAQGAGTTAGKDFEDALHLYLVFEGELKGEALEGYVEQLGVEDYYAELREA